MSVIPKFVKSGYIQICQSVATGKKFPVYVASGDTDMVTNGLASVTSVSKKIVAVGYLNKEEYAEGPESPLFQQRMRQKIGINDLVPVKFLRAEKNSPSGQGMSFQEFRKVYALPKLIYSDIYSENGEAPVIKKVSIAQFKLTGGKLRYVET